MALDGNIRLEVTSTAEFIPTAICLLKKYVTAKANVVNSINLTPDNSQQKAETEALISQFDLAIRRFESSLKPLDKKIDASIYSLSRQQKFIQEKNCPPSLPLNNSRQCPLVACTSTEESINKAITQVSIASGLVWPVEQSLLTSCPFCKRNSLTKSTLSEHISENHPKHIEVYENISSLTPEFMLATEKTISGNRQCFYCPATFRSNAPSFRHIQEAHVAYFDIFVNISLLRGDTMQCLKSNNANRPAPAGTLHPLQSSITRSPVKPVNDRKNQVLTSSTTPVCIESLADPSQTANCKPTVSAISTPQNARKSIRTSTITRFSPIAAISSTQSADNSISVQGTTAKVASSTCPKVIEPVHSARKRRIITSNMPAPASKKIAAIAQASGSRVFACSLCSKQFASVAALSIHNAHYCSMRPPEVMKASKGSLPSLPNGAVTQSRAVSSSRESPTEDVDCSSSEEENSDSSMNEVPEDVKRKLIKTVRDAEVVLNTIHQEDLVSCMHSINFRKLQNLELV